jgi:hypothetical protein
MYKISSSQMLAMIIKDITQNKYSAYYSSIFKNKDISQVVKILSKFKSRYEIAFYMTDININNIEKTPFAKNNRERLKSYSSMIKFFLTYSAFEYFGNMQNIGDDTKNIREYYELIEDKDRKQFLDSISKNIEKLSIYLKKNVDSKYLCNRIDIFKGSDLNDSISNEIKSYLNKIFHSQKSLKYKDILCLPKAMRHQIAHGKFAATYTSKMDTTYLSVKDMISIYNAFNKLLLKLIDKKLKKIYNERK